MQVKPNRTLTRDMKKWDFLAWMGIQVLMDSVSKKVNVSKTPRHCTLASGRFGKKTSVTSLSTTTSEMKVRKGSYVSWQIFPGRATNWTRNREYETVVRESETWAVKIVLIQSSKRFSSGVKYILLDKFIKFFRKLPAFSFACLFVGNTGWAHLSIHSHLPIHHSLIARYDRSRIFRLTQSITAAATRASTKFIRTDKYWLLNKKSEATICEYSQCQIDRARSINTLCQ